MSESVEGYQLFEVLEHRVPELHFKPEGYKSSGDAEYLEGLLDKLKNEGFEPQTLVFSGFDGTQVAGGEQLPRYPYIFGMNEAAWRQAIKYREANPAEYAQGWQTPCIALYDKQQLAQVYSSVMHLSEIEDRIELSGIDVGEPLSELDPGVPVQEALVHKDYPDGSPSDALVGLVYLDE